MLQVGSQLIAGVRDQRDAAQITAAAEKEFRALHPGRIVNLRAQVTALANQAAQSGRHPVLITAEPVAAALRQHPLARIDEVRHQAPSRTVRLIVSASDQASLEAVIAAMRAGGLALDRRDTPPREGRTPPNLGGGPAMSARLSHGARAHRARAAFGADRRDFGVRADCAGLGVLACQLAPRGRRRRSRQRPAHQRDIARLGDAIRTQSAGFVSADGSLQDRALAAAQAGICRSRASRRRARAGARCV